MPNGISDKELRFLHRGVKDAAKNHRIREPTKEWSADQMYETSTGRKRPSARARREKGFLNESRLAKPSSKTKDSDDKAIAEERSTEENEEEDEAGEDEDENEDEGGDGEDEDEDEGDDVADEDEDEGDDVADEDGAGPGAQLQSELEGTTMRKR